MKSVKLYEYSDLVPEIKEKIENNILNQVVEGELQILSSDKELSEKEYWNEIGCSKSYGESTGWFVPSVYYENHKQSIDEIVQDILIGSLFDKRGAIVAL